MKIFNFYIFLLLVTSSCGFQDEEQNKLMVNDSKRSDAIISNVFASDSLTKHGLFSTEWQDELSLALLHDSTNAYLWQQKSMPLYKQGKYQLGRPFLDKAAQYDPQQYLDYRAFMICIFEKNYREAIEAFEECKRRYTDTYVMDHSYSFYIAISKIQLNEFEDAETLLMGEVARQTKDFGKENVHFLDLFYLGIARYELNRFSDAIEAFDASLQIYSRFADAQLYKSRSLKMLGRSKESEQLYDIARVNGKADHTISEDNSFYERYPYQVRWDLFD